MSRKRQAETAASLGAALETLGTPAQAVAAIERSIAIKVMDATLTRHEPITINEPSLPALAKQINVAWIAIDAATVTIHDHRIQIGNLLKMARARMPETGAFALWCKANIKRGKSDIYRCLALVKSDDPAEQIAAREAEKETARQSMVASRAADVARVNSPTVGEKALATVNASKPAPSAAVWCAPLAQTPAKPQNEPASQTRDKSISAQATALSQLTGYALRDAMTLQIRLLQGNKVATMTDAARMELLRLIDKLRDEIKPGV